MDGLDSRASTGETNGNESAMFRVIPAFESFRRTVSRVCGAFIAHLFRPFRQRCEAFFLLEIGVVMLGGE